MADLVPVYIDGEPKLVRHNQLWFWSDEWQAGEREVDEEILDGKYELFNSIDEFIAGLLDG